MCKLYFTIQIFNGATQLMFIGCWIFNYIKKKNKKNLGGKLKTPPKSILKTSSLEFTVNSTQKKKNSLAFCFQLLSRLWSLYPAPHKADIPHESLASHTKPR
jgi:hypothetical protein